MDQDTLQAVVTEAMRQTPYQIDWNPILWLGGTFFTIIAGLLTWIGVLLRSDRDGIIIRADKHENWILEQRGEFAQIVTRFDKAIQQNATAIEYIGKIQDEGVKRLELFEIHLRESRNKRK